MLKIFQGKSLYEKSFRFVCQEKVQVSLELYRGNVWTGIDCSENTLTESKKDCCMEDNLLFHTSPSHFLSS